MRRRLPRMKLFPKKRLLPRMKLLPRVFEEETVTEDPA